jgi:antitoxin (DNA-binding transcriptional repressor) of toxin-antitoxin stability system
MRRFLMAPLLLATTVSRRVSSWGRRPAADGSEGNVTDRVLSYKMLYMKKAINISIRELQQNLKRVIARVERGQIVEVTRHRRPVARRAPLRPIRAVPPWPDLGARTRAVFGDRLVTPGPSESVIEDRGER